MAEDEAVEIGLANAPAARADAKMIVLVNILVLGVGFVGCV